MRSGSLQASRDEAQDQRKRSVTEGTNKRPYNILFLCTGNSARSILAEAIIERYGKGQFQGYSAGSYPKGAVNPLALKLLNQMRRPTAHLRSKSWHEFAVAGAPVMDFVFTVCDQAAGETCPVWPGQPVTAHWGIPDPAAVEGSEAERTLAFAEAYRQLERRIKLFLSLPLASLNRMTITSKVREIGRARDDTVRDRAS
jgi:arsenate reductase